MVRELNSILSMQIAAISYAWNMLKFINETSGMYKINYSFRMDIVGKVIKVISCIEILVNDIKIYTIDQNMFYGQ